MGSLVLSAGPQVAPDHRDRIIASLEQENRDLKMQLRDAQGELAIARNANGAAVSRLRAQLSPLYQALQAVFGEMEAFTDVSDSGPQIDGRKRGVWESWKTKLPGKPAEFIDILMTHGEMTAAQLRIAGKCASDTVYQTIYKLNKAGLLNKNGGKFSLKEL